MNGTGKIEIVKPLNEGFEMMKKILFQPFNAGKWFVIGFAAFLAGHFAGVGFNFPIGGFPPKEHGTSPEISPEWEEWKPWLPIFIALFIVVVLVLVVLFSWLKARGNFIFTDCIARNRAAIVDPWREYRREGNSYFLFLLLVTFGALAAFGVIALLVAVTFGVGVHPAFSPIALICFILLFIAWICFCIFFAVISYFMVPLMYVRRCRAVEAFRQVVALVLANPGSFILFCLFGACLLIGAGMIGGIATCATCCLAALPYIGTVILLPVFICLRAYGLFFIRQFGPDYDVWAATSPPLPSTTAIEPPPAPI